MMMMMMKTITRKMMMMMMKTMTSMMVMMYHLHTLARSMEGAVKE